MMNWKSSSRDETRYPTISTNYARVLPNPNTTKSVSRTIIDVKEKART